MDCGKKYEINSRSSSFPHRIIRRHGPSSEPISLVELPFAPHHLRVRPIQPASIDLDRESHINLPAVLISSAYYLILRIVHLN